MPQNNLCIVDLEDVDENMVMRNKKCILNYHNIDDPWDVDSNGIFKYAQTQVTNEALVIVDDYCLVAGTDTNYPWTNQFGVDPANTPFYQEVTDTRFMVVCFVEPIFSLEYPFLMEFSKEEATTEDEVVEPPAPVTEPSRKSAGSGRNLKESDSTLNSVGRALLGVVNYVGMIL